MKRCRMQRCNTDTFAQRRSYLRSNAFNHGKLLHTDAIQDRLFVTHRRVYTHTVTHHFYTPIRTFTHRRVYAQTCLHTDTFTHRHAYAENLYTRTRLHTLFFHTDVHTYRSLHTQTLSNIAAVTKKGIFDDALQLLETVSSDADSNDRNRHNLPIPTGRQPGGSDIEATSLSFGLNGQSTNGFGSWYRHKNLLGLVSLCCSLCRNL